MTRGVCVIHEAPGAPILLRFWGGGEHHDVEVTKYTATLLAELSEALRLNMTQEKTHD